MRRHKRFYLFLLLIAFLPFSNSLAQKSSGQVPAPSEFLKFEVGADRQLADYRQIASYFKTLAATSSRLQVEPLGKTTLGEDNVHGRDLQRREPAQ